MLAKDLKERDSFQIKPNGRIYTVVRHLQAINQDINSNGYLPEFYILAIHSGKLHVFSCDKDVIFFQAEYQESSWTILGGFYAQSPSELI